MNYWIFIVTQRKVDGVIVFGDEVLKQRLSDKFWGIGEKTPNRRLLDKGDRVVFYVGNPSYYFAAAASLGTGSFALSEKQKAQFDHGKPFYRTDLGVLLEDIQIWETPRPAKELIGALAFIENRTNWGAYFQGGVRQVSEEDFRIISENRTAIPVAPPTPAEITTSESQFALEAHLEEFIDKNWIHINFGSALTRYEVEDQDGRQFPAGTWSIDFLCTDNVSGDFVVIELKRGQTSDATVGQVLRYIGWVQTNLAKKGQSTRGIIIAQQVDDALKFAVNSLSNVSVLAYQVDFKLHPFKT